LEPDDPNCGIEKVYGGLNNCYIRDLIAIMGLRRALRKFFKKTPKEENKYLQNIYQTNHGRSVLVCYITTPFRSEDTFVHQNYLTSHIIAESFSSLGYDVDVVEYIGEFEIDYDRYSVIFGFGHSFERSFYSRNRTIPRIHFVTGTHQDTQNAMSMKSVIDFYELSGLWLPHEGKVMAVSWYYSLFNADATVILAQGYIYEDYARRTENKLYSLNNNILGTFNELKPKNIKARNRNFLYLSGVRQLTKGLPILLETAKLRPELNFYVIVFSVDEELYKHYADLLGGGKNVFLYKHLRMDSVEMKTIIENCSYCIAPSYADGLPGGTIEPMAAGLIPVVSKYCGFPREEFIFEMEELSVHGLNNTIDKVLEMDDDAYVACSDRVKAYTQANFSPAAVKKQFQSIIQKILGNEE
jgi:glycosyltransferase involved in cell wall biosynthesis